MGHSKAVRLLIFYLSNPVAYPFSISHQSPSCQRYNPLKQSKISMPFEFHMQRPSIMGRNTKQESARSPKNKSIYDMYNPKQVRTYHAAVRGINCSFQASECWRHQPGDPVWHARNAREAPVPRPVANSFRNI